MGGWMDHLDFKCLLGYLELKSVSQWFLNPGYMRAYDKRYMSPRSSSKLGSQSLAETWDPMPG